MSRKEKIVEIAYRDCDEAISMLYMWVKQDVINKQEFLSLMREIIKIEIKDEFAYIQ